MKLEENKQYTQKRSNFFMIIVSVGCCLLVIKKIIEFFSGYKSMIYFAILYALLPIFIYYIFNMLQKETWI